MKVLVEECSYDKSQVEILCGGLEKGEGETTKISKVGYYFNPAINDCVISLPKVIKDEGKETVFGGIEPKDLINVFSDNEDRLSDSQKDFIRDFSLWSYRTISTYKKLNIDSNIVEFAASSSYAPSEEEANGTILDISLAIINFYKQNKDYIMYIVKNIHSGYNKIHWRKTIAKKTPILQDEAPIYMEVINRKKQINFDEELMIIFHSILDYISNTLGIKVDTEFNYELLSQAEFESYRAGLGITRLRSIKYKYFSDIDLKMWKLCYSFFEKMTGIQEAEGIEDYLIVRNFEKVFESMIDNLISDEDIPKELRNQEDGKEVDHVFLHESPIDGSPIYYIGDSKYYKVGSSVKGKSEYKQYTYAKNIIQYHFKPENKATASRVKYRDELTEGYNFTPNFFISAYIPNELSYENSELKRREKFERIYHFENRLFDRDTLWLAHYDINLLYVMKLYAEDDTNSKVSFKINFKDTLLKAFQKLLEDKYDFYLIQVKDDLERDPDAKIKFIEKFIQENFYILNGKVYKLPNGNVCIALEKDTSDRCLSNIKLSQGTIEASYHCNYRTKLISLQNLHPIPSL